jgi:hypothetical protein
LPRSGATINLTFDPKPGSKNRRTLDAYLAEKAKKSGGTNSTKPIKPSSAPQDKGRATANRAGLTSAKEVLSLVLV